MKQSSKEYVLQQAYKKAREAQLHREVFLSTDNDGEGDTL